MEPYEPSPIDRRGAQGDQSAIGRMRAESRQSGGWIERLQTAAGLVVLGAIVLFVILKVV